MSKWSKEAKKLLGLGIGTIAGGVVALHYSYAIASILYISKIFATIWSWGLIGLGVITIITTLVFKRWGRIE